MADDGAQDTMTFPGVETPASPVPETSPFGRFTSEPAIPFQGFGQAADVIGVPQRELMSSFGRVMSDQAAGQIPDQSDVTQMFLQAGQEEAARRQAAAGAQAGLASQKAGLYQDFLAQPRPDVYQPKYREMPKAPTPQYRDPMQAVGSPLSVLALAAGLFTRTPATATLNAASAAMQAQRAGDQQGYENARNEFRDKLDETLKHNDQERTAYLDSWNNRKMTMQERLADLEMKAAMYQNQALANSARSGNVSQVQMQLDAMGKAQEFMKQFAPTAKSVGEWQAQEAQKVAARVKSEHPDWADDKVYAEVNRILRPIFEVSQKPGAATAVSQQNQFVMQRVAELDAQGKSPTEAFAQARREATGRGLTSSEEITAAAKRYQQSEVAAGRPEPDLNDAITHVMETRASARRAPPGLWFQQLNPGLSSVLTDMGSTQPGFIEELNNKKGTLGPTDQRQLIRAKTAMDGAEDIARFIVAKPWSVGLVSQLAKNIPGIDLTKEYTVSDATALLSGAAGSVDGKENELARRYKVTPSQISDAIVLYKKLIQQSLDDAASTGRPTVFLERLLLSGVYRQDVRPETMLRITQDREYVTDDKFKSMIDPRASFKATSEGKYPFYKTGWQDYARGANMNLYQSSDDKTLAALQQRGAIDAATAAAIKLGRTPKSPEILSQIVADDTKSELIRDAARLLLQYRYKLGAQP